MMDVMTRGDRVTAVAEAPLAVPATKGPAFHALPVKAVIRETADAISIVFEVPADLEEHFRYQAGQFVTFRVDARGEEELRSYSMSSAPGIDRDLQVTVKRVTDGVVSNWLNTNLQVGDRLEVSPPSGRFVLPAGGLSSDLIAFTAGSGITPVFSIIKSVLSETDRTVRMIYANRDRSSVIFHESLQSLEARYPGRLHVGYSVDEDTGFVTPGMVADFLGSGLRSEFYICGPKPFMDMVTSTLVWCGARSDQMHVEAFSPEDELAGAGLASDVEITVTLGGRTVTIGHRPEWTLVQAARAAGLRPPSSCHLGQCGTCVARITDGAASMSNNQVLTTEEVAEGWILTCQAKPITPHVSVVYE
jgi:3-ketosteroid 9alpha-monooxygenase subunit B